MEQRQQGRGWDGRFLGFRARKNCEEMPVIPAWLVRSNLNDARRIPYLLVWKDERHGEIMEAVRLRCVEKESKDFNRYVELKRTNGSTTVLRILWRMLPRKGGFVLFLLCPCCETPRRHVYGWEWNPFSGRSNVVMSVSWRCRSCARLRYSSEGGCLRPPSLGPLGQLGVTFRASWGNLPRPGPWLPYVLTSIDDLSIDEIIGAQLKRGTLA